MIGDGVNNAPALKTADAVWQWGATGSDMAIDAENVAQMEDNNSKLPYLKWLCNTTSEVAISLSMWINFVAIALSVLGILKFHNWSASPQCGLMPCRTAGCPAL